MDASTGALPLLRLLQITDSSFPVGGYAYSHGLEWLVFERRVSGEAELGEMLTTFVGQTLRRQWLPAASAAFRAKSQRTLNRVDLELDASISAAAERDAGRAMGARLMAVAPLSNEVAGAFREAMGTGGMPGQYAVAFAVVAREFEIGEGPMLAALGYSMVTSVTQAAVRLGTIGADAATRLVAAAMPGIAQAVAEVAVAKRQRIGSFAPGIELAAMLQPTLRFRMFAS